MNNDYSLRAFILVNANAKTKTIIMIIKSMIISKLLAVVNSWIMPTVHIPIRTKGSKYLIMKDHFLPTLNMEFSFNTGMM